MKSENKLFFGTLLMFVLVMLVGMSVASADDVQSTSGRKAAVALVKDSGLDKLLATLKAETTCKPEYLIEGLILGDETAWACLGLETLSTKTQIALK